MLDFNHRPAFHEWVTGFIDAALDAERAEQTPRDYLGASRLGVACERALQYEYAGAPVDPGRGFSGRILRVFEVGHVLEDLAVRWLRMAGFELHNQKANGGQFGFSVAGGRIKGHVDGIITAAPPELELTFPMLFECKTMADKHWKACAKSGVAVTKPVYAAQMVTYQAYMEGTVDGISRNPATANTPKRTRASSPGVPRLTATNSAMPIASPTSMKIEGKALTVIFLD